MKRIREFRVSVLSSDGMREHTITGWHKAWDLAASSLNERCLESRIYDAGAKRSAIIALFSEHNLQEELDDIASEAIKTRWRSESLQTTAGDERFANINLTDFGWSWVEGAARDLPFRLSYLERDAERNPDGFIAFVLGLGAEARDLLRRV